MRGPRLPLSRRFPLFAFCFLFSAFLLLFAFPISAFSQDALGFSLAGEAAARARNQASEGQAYNLRLGNVRFLADASLNAEATDNYNLSDLDPQSDVILRPQVNTRVIWPITPKNTLNFSLGLGYAAYLSHSQYSYLIVAPGSELSFDLYVQDFKFTFFDRFSYTQDPLQNGAVSGVARFGGLENSAGLNALWDLNKVLLSAGYAYQIFNPDQQQFQYLQRGSHLFNARAAFLLSPTVTVGPEASSSLTSYDLSYLNNAMSYSGGGFASVRLSSHMTANAHAGFVAYEFEAHGPIAAGQNPQTYYFSVGVEHTLNEFISHSLTGGREVRLGTYSDFQEVFYGRYNINWKINRHVGLGAQFFYEHGTYPPVRVQLPGIPQISLFGETYDRVGAELSLSYQLMKKLSSSIGYRLTLKDSDQPGRNYAQNALTLGLTYQF